MELWPMGQFNGKDDEVEVEVEPEQEQKCSCGWNYLCQLGDQNRNHKNLILYFWNLPAREHYGTNKYNALFQG